MVFSSKFERPDLTCEREKVLRKSLLKVAAAERIAFVGDADDFQRQRLCLNLRVRRRRDQRCFGQKLVTHILRKAIKLFLWMFNFS